MNVLFVCTQNIFRSYSAHKLLEKYLKEQGDKVVNVDSCGTIASPWESPYSFTTKYLENQGISSSHLNKKITQDLVNWADIVVNMTKDHKEFVEKNFKNSKCVLFNELAIGKNTNLEDDNETQLLSGEMYSLEDFVLMTVKHIHKGIPRLYESLEKQ